MSGTRTFLKLGLALALVFGARNASADSIPYVLTDTNLSGFTGPFATVTVTWVDATHATITYDSLTNGGYQYLLVSGTGQGTAIVGANVHGTATSTFTGTPYSTASPNGITDNSPSTMDGFGQFSNTGAGPNSGLSGAYTEVVMQLTAATGTTWANASDVLTGNDKNQILAVHIGALAPGGTAFTATGNASGAHVVPEPSTMAIASLGALGFAGFGLRRRLKK